MAIKYADKDYLEKLESIKALNLSNVDKQKRKSKRCMLASILVTCALLIVAVIAYFVFIPLGRYHIYESLIKDERIDEAIEMYLDSRWHEDGNYVKSIFYDHGIELYNKKEYNSAKKLLKVTNGYNDSEEKIIEIDNVLRISKIKNTKIGDTVTFGVYEQDGILENGSEKIEWIVLKKDNKKALIISKYCLDCIPYTLDAVDEAMWETSYLRTWLNNNFYNKSFDDFEKEHIINSTINNYDYVHVSTGKKLQFMDGTEGSYILVPSKVEREATRDYLFVLSIDEAEDFFDTSKKRKAKPTLYAKNNGADTSYGDGSHAFWWLRNDPDMNYNHSLVSGKGGISTNSISVDNLWATVRPAMWINIEE